MNADHEEAVEFAKVSKRENRVYVGNLSYDVKYRDLMEFMRGGGWGNLRSSFSNFFHVLGRPSGLAWRFLGRSFQNEWTFSRLGMKSLFVLETCGG
jgi:hypothetical protein